MQIFGIDISSKNFGLDQIYIRCMAGLSVLAGIIFPTYSSWASQKGIDIDHTARSQSAITGYYYRALVGAPGVTAALLDYYPSRNGSRCVSGYCFVFGEYTDTDIGCPESHIDPSQHDGIRPAGYCYVNPSGVCNSAGCYPYFYAPLSVMKRLGCTSGDVAPSGNPRLDKCYYEAAGTSSFYYAIGCNSAYSNNPLPLSGFYIPYIPLLHDKMVESWGGDRSIVITLLEYGPRWIDGASGRLELDSASYDSYSYCNYAGCPAIWLTDASGGYTVSESYETSPISNQYGTSSWRGTPPDCTATLKSTKADGTSSDPAGTWTISCTYSK